MTKLTLNTTKLSPEKKEEVKKLKNLTKKPHLDVPITFEDIKKAEQWLRETYPLVFSEKRHLPLKIGIEKDIFQNQGDALPFSRALVRKAIGFYVKHPLYLKNILEGSLRYDLQGHISGTVDQTHKDNAQEILTNRKEKNNDKI